MWIISNLTSCTSKSLKLTKESKKKITPLNPHVWLFAVFLGTKNTKQNKRAGGGKIQNKKRNHREKEKEKKDIINLCYATCILNLVDFGFVLPLWLKLTRKKKNNRALCPIHTCVFYGDLFLHGNWKLCSMPAVSDDSPKITKYWLRVFGETTSLRVRKKLIKI